MMMAAHWVASGAAPGAKALVITTDQSRESLNEHYEYVMGAGAVALLISAEPRVLQLDLTRNGYFTCEATDTFRPTSRVETGNNEVSLFSYLDALEGAYQHFLSKAGPVDYDAFFQWHLYHVPFGPFIPDLSAPGKYFIIPVLLGASSFLQMRLMPMQGDPMQQKMMQYMMPAIFTVFMLFLPAGLGIYFMTNTWLGIGQQLAVERYYRSRGASMPPASTSNEKQNAATESKPRPTGKGSSGVQQRG